MANKSIVKAYDSSLRADGFRSTGFDGSMVRNSGSLFVESSKEWYVRGLNLKSLLLRSVTNDLEEKECHTIMDNNEGNDLETDGEVGDLTIRRSTVNLKVSKIPISKELTNEKSIEKSFMGQVQEETNFRISGGLTRLGECGYSFRLDKLELIDIPVQCNFGNPLTNRKKATWKRYNLTGPINKLSYLKEEVSSKKKKV
ncbi:hypothetical protein PTKIN_Ptkin15bG0073300 [Pterospermum kingtungense]